MVIEPAHHRLDAQPRPHRRPARIGESQCLGHRCVLVEEGVSGKERELAGG